MRLFQFTLLIVVLAFTSNSQAAVGGGGESTTTTTTSTTHGDTFTDFFSEAKRIDTFLTRLTARVDSGPILIDLNFNLPFSDPSVQTAIEDAQTTLQEASLTSLLFPDPLLLSNLEELLDTQTHLIDQSLNHQEFAITTQTTFGPATILIGEDQSITFFVLPGSTNVNTNTHTQSFFFRTFQNQDTYLISQHYEILATSFDAAAVPEPASLSLLSMGLASLIFRRRAKN